MLINSVDSFDEFNVADGQAIKTTKVGLVGSRRGQCHELDFIRRRLL